MNDTPGFFEKGLREVLDNEKVNQGTFLSVLSAHNLYFDQFEHKNATKVL
jgi:hypothetical protein